MAATPKLRSRKEGAARPLEDVERRLLNLLQGSFPLDPRPYAAVANEAGLSEDEVIARTQTDAARRPDHPPGHADLRHPRARLRLDARRREGRSRAPVAGRQDRQLAPRRQPQLPAQPRVQHVVHDRGRGGLAARPAGHARRPAGLTAPSRSASCRRSSSSRSAWTSRWRARPQARAVGEAVAPIELDRQPYDDFDVAVIRATQGDLPVVPEPFAPAAAGSASRSTRCSDHMIGMRERGLLRRVAAILFHRRAGFSANGMGVWKVPEDRILEIGPRMAAFRGVSHCYQRPTYEDWPYQIFTMPTGAPRRSATRSSTRSRPRSAASRTGRRCTRRPSSRRSGSSTSPRRSSSGRPPTRADAGERLRPRHALGRALRPGAAAPPRGGQLAGPRDARDRPRPAVRRARPRRRADRRRRQPLRRLGVLLGAADPGARRALGRRGRRRGRARGHHVRRAEPPARSTSPRRCPAGCPASRCCA